MSDSNYDQIKSIAQTHANLDGVEYGIRFNAPTQTWEYAEAAWYAVVHNREGWSLDDIEVVAPSGEEISTWPEIARYMADVDEPSDDGRQWPQAENE